MCCCTPQPFIGCGLHLMRSYAHSPILASALSLLLCSGADAGLTLFVNGDALPGGNGQTWATAFVYLQDALAAARASGSDVTEVWVAAGTYKPDRDAAHPTGTGDRAATFELISGVALRGGFAGTEDPTTFDLSTRDFGANSAILSGDLVGNDLPPALPISGNDENSFTVVTAGGGLDSTAVIDGFTISGGNNNGGTGLGGGMFCSSSSPAIRNNTITFNAAGSGGGICCAASSSPTISNNAITHNRASGRGGGILCIDSSSPSITNNTIDMNTISSNGPAGTAGAGIACVNNSSPTISTNGISENSIVPLDPLHGFGSGGGIYCESSSSIISGNTIHGNSIGGNNPLFPFASVGGGICCFFGSPTLDNNSIAENFVDGTGGGIYCVSGALMIRNTIVRNRARSFSGGIECNGDFGTQIINNVIAGNGDSGIASGDPSCVIADNTIAGNEVGVSCNGAPTIVNNIVTFNSAGLEFNAGSTPSIRSNCAYANTAFNYSGVPNPTGIDGNISADPHFVQTPIIGVDGVWGTSDDILGDLHLLLGSPCIDAGNNADVPAGVLTDLGGQPRFADDPCTTDAGAGVPPVVDIGAHEYQPGAFCPPVSIVSWKSLRSHAELGDVAILLDPARTGNGSSGPVSEPRAAGPIHIQIEFDTAAVLISPLSVTVQGQTTVNGILGSIVHYAAQIQMIGPTTLDIVLPANAPDQTCYRIDLSGAIPLLKGDRDCMFRALAGDTNSDGQVDLSDALLTKANVGQLASNFPRFDVTLSGGAVNLTDAIFAYSLVTNPMHQALCP